MQHAIIDTVETPQQVSREKIERLDAYLAQLPQIDLQTKHYISGGLYAREITIPAGTALTGAAHKQDHINVCLGDIIVWTEGGMKRITGHATMESKAGAKRVGLALVDTIWTTFHQTDKANIEEIEEELFEESERLQTRQLGLPSRVQTMLEL